MKGQSISFNYSNVMMNQEKRQTGSISNKWAYIVTFVIISYLISEVFIVKIKRFPINIQQCALLATVIISLSRTCKLGKACKALIFSTGLYVSFSGISFFYSAAPKAGMIYFASLVVNWLFLVAICRIGSSDYTIQNVDVFFKWLIRLGIFEALLGLLQVFTGKLWISSRSSIESLVVGGVTRAPGTFRDPTYFAYYLVACFLWLYIKLLVQKKKKKKILALLLLLLMGILLSGSFTSILALCIGVLSISAVKGNLFQVLGKVAFTGLTFGIAGIIFFSLFQSYKGSDYYEKKIITLRPDNYENNVRVMHLVTGWNMLKTRPIMGHGYGTFETQSQYYVPEGYFIAKVWRNKYRNRNKVKLTSHVFFATLMGELGVLGIVIFTYLVGTMLKTVFKARKILRSEPRDNTGRHELSLFFIGFIASYFIRMLGYGFRLSDSFIIIFVVMGMLIVDDRMFLDASTLYRQGVE